MVAFAPRALRTPSQSDGLGWRPGIGAPFGKPGNSQLRRPAKQEYPRKERQRTSSAHERELGPRGVVISQDELEHGAQQHASPHDEEARNHGLEWPA